MQIGIIGSGRVGKAIHKALKNKGFDVPTIVVKQQKKYGKMPTILYNQMTTQQKNIPIWFIATSDDAIEQVIIQYDFLKGKSLFHLSGSVSSRVLSTLTEDYGVFYPLHSFNGTKVNFSEIPVFLTASSNKALDTLTLIAHKLNSPYHIITDEQRQHIHLAAVFANNFTNHMYHIAEQILNKQNIDFETLHHLIKSHIENILSGQKPNNIQTGPAKRNDKKIIEKHLNLLETNKDWQNVYKFVSQSITNTNKDKNENRQKF